MKHINQLFVSALVTTIIVACGGMKVSMAPDANAQESDAGTADITKPTACECSSEPGPQGPAGPVGQMGPAGAQGERGLRGATGEAGTQGPIGPAGAQGSVGPRGVAGVQGVVGPQGPKGDQGSPGASGQDGAFDPSRVYEKDNRVQMLGGTMALSPVAACDAGDTLLSGGCAITTGTNVGTITGSIPDLASNGWQCFARKSDLTTVEVLARVLCLAQN